MLSFGFAINAQPRVVTFAVEGLATVEGDEQAVERLFQMAPNTQVPEIANQIYKRVYTSVFVLASLVGITPPSPGLLHSPAATKMVEEPAEPQAEVEAEQGIQQPAETS